MASFSPPNADVPLETALSSGTSSQPPPTATPAIARIISRVSACLVLSIEILIHIELYVFRDHEEYIMSRRKSRTPSPYILGNVDVEKELLVLQVPATNVVETRCANVTCDTNSGREVTKQKKTKFASIVPENMKLVYLRQSFIQKLLKTESYETKLTGSFVRVPLPLNDCRRMHYQLVQVTGVINEVGSIKLQLLGMAREISIDLLQERNFKEEECDALRLKMNSGLIKKPTLICMTFQNFAKEMRNIEAEIGHKNEKGYRYIYPFIASKYL
ncbi:hypothetical protein M9H77_06460 [Catharanthus roseus]|uniref:Uncharacterized protein n=1 Tax=Catharanthus roseus TaxID=4058 RepID=A0ACC0BSA7_CATRO|nr:hypothetical protein M9H77_06460 [Catharanthus roseus]